MRTIATVIALLFGCNPAGDDAVDQDRDGYDAQDDCDDTDPDVHPGATEVCDGVDNDCDPATDETLDADEDGVSTICGDCDDDDPSRTPGAEELCDGIDNDCDGAVPPAEADTDGDGALDCGDCAPEDASVFPLAEELCDGIDNDCDLAVDLDDDDLVDLCGTFGLSNDVATGWVVRYISWPPSFSISATTTHTIDIATSDGHTHQFEVEVELDGAVSSIIAARPYYTDLGGSKADLDAIDSGGDVYSTSGYTLYVTSSGSTVYEDLGLNPWDPAYWQLDVGPDTLVFDPDLERSVAHLRGETEVYDYR